MYLFLVVWVWLLLGATDYLEHLVSKMSCCVSGMLNPQSLSHLCLPLQNFHKIHPQFLNNPADRWNKQPKQKDKLLVRTN